ncbi:hypothetical protein BC829DRAFT_459308, partial [Chytridium lagenaria]
PPSGIVGVVSYSYSGTSLTGVIQLQNLAYAKLVTVYYQTLEGTWNSGNAIPATFSGKVVGTSFELWWVAFSGGILKLRAFYVKYTVGGRDYYDSRGGVNYLI